VSPGAGRAPQKLLNSNGIRGGRKEAEALCIRFESAVPHELSQRISFILSCSCSVESTELRYRRMQEKREDASSPLVAKQVFILHYLHSIEFTRDRWWKMSGRCPCILHYPPLGPGS